VSMYESGNESKIRSEGFSLLDMKTYLERSDFHANGYRHFVVVKGLLGDEILVGDPALGAKIYTRSEFEPMWNGIVFVITDRLDVAKRTFNDKRERLVRHKTPFGSALSRNGLASFTMLLRGPGDF
jgi:predicted double-glycine peptidase